MTDARATSYRSEHRVLQAGPLENWLFAMLNLLLGDMHGHHNPFYHILPNPAFCQVPATTGALWVWSGTTVSTLTANDFNSHVACGLVSILLQHEQL